MRSEVIFIGHGSPMNVVLDNEWTRNWTTLSSQVKEPKAILAISAHWYIDETAISDKEEYEQIYDMYGFSEEIYQVKYLAKSDKKLEERIKELLGSDLSINNKWGLDHGLWSVLKFMYPKADIPLVVLSIDRNLSARQHFEIAKKLRVLREEGYLILTSGNIVHNLRLADWNNPDLSDQGKVFDDMVLDKISSRSYEDLVDYKNLEGHQYAIPTPDHYLPFVYALGFLYGDEETLMFNRGGELGSISMTSYIFK